MYVYNRDLSRGKIESIFEHFTKFNQRKMDSSQNSTLQKQTLHKIQCQKTGLFTKFNSVQVLHFSGNATPCPSFRSYKCALRFFRSQKLTLPIFRSEKWILPFFHYQPGEKAGFLPKIMKWYLKNKYAFGKFLHSKIRDFAP